MSKSRFSGHVVDINIPGISPDKSDQKTASFEIPQLKEVVEPQLDTEYWENLIDKLKRNKRKYEDTVLEAQRRSLQ